MIKLGIKQVYQIRSEYRIGKRHGVKGNDEKVRMIPWLRHQFFDPYPHKHNHTFSAFLQCLVAIFEPTFHYRTMEQSWEMIHIASSESFWFSHGRTHIPKGALYLQKGISSLCTHRFPLSCIPIHLPLYTGLLCTIASDSSTKDQKLRVPPQAEQNCLWVTLEMEERRNCVVKQESLE